MTTHLSRSFLIALLFVLGVGCFIVVHQAASANGATMAERLSGRILLQVQQHGEAWYVHPTKKTRFFLARPTDAFNVMRYQGLGITDADLAKIPEVGTSWAMNVSLRDRLVGRILLQVQQHGEAWYVNPTDEKRYYLGRPTDAFNIMRTLGLGITDSDLGQITRDADSISDTFFRWSFNGSTWQPQGNAPGCDSLVPLRAPVDLTMAASVLYPGQYRGSDYKPHGGFRLDGQAYDSVTVQAPFDAYVIDAARYTEGGTVQYLFDFMSSCGLLYRFDHLFTLSPTLATIASKLPVPTEGDSRTTALASPVLVRAGEVVATAVGTPSNVFFDWGVYDLRNRNAAAADAAYQAAHADEVSQAWYAVCWFDWLSSADKTTVRSLPASGGDASSDYCT